MSEVRDELFYTKDHEWIHILENYAYVGITDYAQSELGEIVFVDVPTVGEEVAQFETFGSIEAVKTVADLNMPMSGKVIMVNSYLDEKPDYVNSLPYDAGWLIQVEVLNMDETKNLMTAEEYRKFIGE